MGVCWLLFQLHFTGVLPSCLSKPCAQPSAKVFSQENAELRIAVTYTPNLMCQAAGINVPVPTGHGMCPVGACVTAPSADLSLAEPVPSGACGHVWEREGEKSLLLFDLVVALTHRANLAGRCQILFFLRLQLPMALEQRYRKGSLDRPACSLPAAEWPEYTNRGSVLGRSSSLWEPAVVLGYQMLLL